MPSKETRIEQHDAPCEMAEGHSEQRAQQRIAEFASEDITERRVLEFLRRRLDCCDVTTSPCTNLRVLGRLLTSHPVLAAKSFLERESNKALDFVLHRAFVARAGDAGGRTVSRRSSRPQRIPRSSGRAAFAAGSMKLSERQFRDREGSDSCAECLTAACTAMPKREKICTTVGCC